MKSCFLTTIPFWLIGHNFVFWYLVLFFALGYLWARSHFDGLDGIIAEKTMLLFVLVQMAQFTLSPPSWIFIPIIDIAPSVKWQRAVYCKNLILSAIYGLGSHVNVCIQYQYQCPLIIMMLISWSISHTPDCQTMLLILPFWKKADASTGARWRISFLLYCQLSRRWFCCSYLSL